MNRKTFFQAILGGVGIGLAAKKAASADLTTGANLNVSGSIVGSGNLTCTVSPFEGEILHTIDAGTGRFSVWCYLKDSQGTMNWQRLDRLEHEDAGHTPTTKVVS